MKKKELYFVIAIVALIGLSAIIAIVGYMIPAWRPYYHNLISPLAALLFVLPSIGGLLAFIIKSYNTLNV